MKTNGHRFIESIKNEEFILIDFQRKKYPFYSVGLGSAAFLFSDRKTFASNHYFL